MADRTRPSWARSPARRRPSWWEHRVGEGRRDLSAPSNVVSSRENDKGGDATKGGGHFFTTPGTMDASDRPLPSPHNVDAQEPTARGLLETVPGGNETDVTISTPRGASPRKSRSGQKTIVSYSDRFIPSRCVFVVVVAAGFQPDLPSPFFRHILSLVALSRSRSLPLFLSLSLSLSHVSSYE